MNKTKIERLMAIKEEFAQAQAQLQKVKKLEERAQASSLSTLLENDLEKAELVLAAQDIMNKLQDMAEDLAKMNAQDLFPLVDKMKVAFGPEASHRFEVSSQDAITQAMNTVRNAKDELGNAILVLEGRHPGNDMADDSGGEMSSEPDMATDAGDEVGDDLEAALDDFGGDDAASGPEEEPLGRAKKEGVESTKAPLNESFILEAAGKKLIETEGLDSLIGWLLNEASTIMTEENFRNFATSVASKAATDPVKLAGWIGKKRNGMAAMAQLADPTYTSSPNLGIVEGKTFKRDEDDDADEKKKKHSERKNARREKMKGDDSVSEGKTFKRDMDDEDEDDDNWDRKARFRSRANARREKMKGDDTLSESHVIAEAMAKMIEANIALLGKGKAAEVVKTFSERTLSEGNEVTVLEAFEEMYGMKPAAYSVTKLKEFAGQLSTNDKKTAAGVMGKIATKMATDKAMAGKPLTSALTGLSGQERAVANKMVAQMKKDGKDPKKVGDFTAGGSEMVGENINAAHWPVDTMGQYKGEPMSTDYGKLKPQSGKETTPKEESSESSENTETAEKPKVETPETKAPETEGKSKVKESKALNELSPETLASYSRKAVIDGDRAVHDANYYKDNKVLPPESKAKKAAELDRRANKRADGFDLAQAKLVKKAKDKSNG